MTKISFTIPAVPIAQPRPRAVTLHGHTRMVSCPTKHPVSAFKATTRAIASQKYSGPPLSGPIKLSVLFVMPRPLSLIWKTRDMPRQSHVKRPDCENLVKGLMDALTGLIWRDDSQVYQLCCNKVIAAGDEQPHVYVEITEEDDD